MTVGVTHRHVLNSEKRPCKEEANYSVVKCMEDFSTAEAGCKSPWDQFDDDKSVKFACFHPTIMSTNVSQFFCRLAFARAPPTSNACSPFTLR